MSVPPIAKVTIQSGLINAGSNILAQAISAYMNEKPFTLDTTVLLQFTTCAIVVSPITFLWLGNLESLFPGFSIEKEGNTNEKKNDAASSTSRSKHHQQQQQQQQQQGKSKLNVKNTVAKIVVDQTIGSAWCTVLFIVTMGALQGRGYEGIWGQIRDDFWPIMIAGFKLWPFVSLLNFTVVPTDKRLLVGNIFGVVWAIYLSLMSG